MEVIVTHISNVEKDEEGNLITDEDGVPQLIDQDAVGVLSKTHIIPLTQQSGGVLQTGVSSACEVFWDKKRTPAPDLIPPGELVWLSLQDGSDEEDESEDLEVDAAEAEEIDATDSDYDDGGYT